MVLILFSFISIFIFSKHSAILATKHTIQSEQHERHAEKLSHIECHVRFKVNLIFLCELYEYSGKEYQEDT